MERITVTIRPLQLDRRTPSQKYAATLAATGRRDLFQPEEYGPEPGDIQDWQIKHLRTSTKLSSWGRMMAIAPLEVIRLLNRAKVSFVLVGGYGIEGWRKESRATEDVDLVVATRHLRKAVKVLCAAFPQLEPVDFDVVLRLRDRETQQVLIDLMKPVQQPYRKVFKHTKKIATGSESYRVPSLEMALAMKFSAMTSDRRQVADKYVDAHDFILMVKKNPDFDREKLAELGSLIYPEGGQDVLEMARQALADERLII